MSLKWWVETVGAGERYSLEWLAQNARSHVNAGQQSRASENFPAFGFLAIQILGNTASSALLQPFGCSPAY